MQTPSTSLEWEEWPPLPVGMSDACSVFLNGTLYVGGGTTTQVGLRAEAALYSFKPGVDSTWTVTDTPTSYYTLVVHDSELLLVGGCEYPTGEVTNKVFTMRDGQFVETLPPMKERRSSPSAVSSGSALIVAGGYGTFVELSSVEMLKYGQWTTAPSLPSEGYDMKSALHGDQWYLLTSLTGNVFHASLQSLILGADHSPWETLPDAPMNRFSAAAFFGGHLLSIGGEDYHNPSTTIHAFSTFTQTWEYVADLPVHLTQPSAVVLPTGELLVIGGKRKKNEKREYSSKKVFRAFLKGMINRSTHNYTHFCAAPLVGDVYFSIPKLYKLRKYGINLMEVLSKDEYRFLITSGVKLLANDKEKALTLSSRDYVVLIFEAWEKSKRPTYPPTWEGLFTVLRKMDLGHLAEQIDKCVTGSLPETEDSPQPFESDVQLSPGYKEQGTICIDS